jgi:transposase
MAAALCYGSRGGGAQLAFHHQQGAYDTDTLIGALEGLRRFLGGQKATLVWDGLPAHRSHAMGAWLRRQRSWLVVEPLPGYAPELNPAEPLWANLKEVELANLAGESLDDIIAAAERGIQRIRHTTIWPSRSCATAVYPCGERRGCHWKERTSLVLLAP